MNPLDMTARALATAVGRGTLDPEAVAESALARLEERNPAINAICAVNPRLLDEAKALYAGLPAPVDVASAD